MRHLPRDFKATQVFDWDAEPADEKPSGFAQSTGFSSLSGYGTAQPARRRRPGNGLGTLLWTAAILASGVLGLLILVSRLRG